MTRHIVCLTFDFDVMSGWVARGMTTPTPISRGEFGIVGARRILALLAKYEIRATWFVPGVILKSYPGGLPRGGRGRPRDRPSRLDSTCRPRRSRAKRRKRG